MKSSITMTAATIAVALATSMMVACPKLPTGGLPGVPGRTSGIDPNTCGNYAASDAGRKLKAFLEATVHLENALKDTENIMRNTCGDMGGKLGVAMSARRGNTKKACQAMLTAFRDHLQVGLKAGARLDVNYKPAVCTVDVDAAAKVAAKCEAKASADVAVRCEGSCSGTCSGGCSGTCNGTCNGTCSGDNSGGQCNGQCDGTCQGSCSGSCQGSCSGGCDGHARVEADAECRAKAEVYASVDAKCTEPELDVAWQAGVAVDPSKLEAAKAALEVGLPQMLQIQARLTGPVKYAFEYWLQTGQRLAKAADRLAGSFDDQALCIAGQLSAMVAAIASIQVSFSVQVEVSAEVSGSVGGGA